MGIVIRQSLKASFASYVGVALGVINNLFVATKFLSPEQLAISRLLLENSLVFASFAHLGLPFITDKFFVFHRNEKEQHHGFLGLIFLWALVGITFFSLLYWFLRENITAYFQLKSPEILAYHFLSIPLTAFWVMMLVLEAYTRNNARIAIPTAVREIFLKGGNIGLILIFALGWISFEFFLYLLVALYGVAVVLLLFYIRILRKWFWKIQWKFFDRKSLYQMAFYGILIALGGIGENLFRFADRVMLAGQEGLRESAIFMLATFIVMTMDIPKKALSQISIPLLSQAIAQNDREKMKELYQKTALHQLLAGAFVFLGIWLCIDEIFLLLPKGKIYAEGKWIVFILGLTTLFNLSTGLRGELILYSGKFYFASIFSFVFAILNIVLNYWLIEGYGVQGAALATAIATSLMILTHLVFVYKIHRIQPFQLKQLYVLIISLAVLGLISLIPTAKNLTELVWVLPLKVLLICVMYCLPVIYFEVSAEVNQIVVKVWQKIKLVFGIR
ncbi:lipopolysaccharide biosynthesis protein [Raineya orbicola]|uniref:Polysaccharide biosynthesis protein n=1 Tax=Raineya orbicola TaxID=2016530 RepID=A0A2N3IJI0_9BACT|nr:polysaccharide biosynthesis C-terminal domain-containing protein [Raineya orbicola]PKQ70474.1 Polysaccharide biosynthesis protein [Raineya orbicola]